MKRKRTHVFLPENLLTEIDALVGQRRRSAFLNEVIEKEVQRLKLLAALEDARGSWKAEDHPELEHGSERWVDRLRRENEDRLHSEA